MKRHGSSIRRRNEMLKAPVEMFSLYETVKKKKLPITIIH